MQFIAETTTTKQTHADSEWKTDRKPRLFRNDTETEPNFKITIPHSPTTVTWTSSRLPVRLRSFRPRSSTTNNVTK